MFSNNTLIITEYNKLLTDINKTKFELNSYKRVIDIIDTLTFDLTKANVDKIKDIKYIGKRTIKRIEEILTYGYIMDYKDKAINNLNEYQIIKNLIKIHGIGIVKAKKLYDDNITYDNIEYHLDNLSYDQKLGVKYKTEIEKPIPRKEITKFTKKLNTLLYKFNSDLYYDICGSYRRGKLESGDIDILITNMGNNDILLQDIVKYLTSNNILVDNLTLHGNKKYMGFAQLDKKSSIRRIDIRLIPLKSYYFALLYFTGSDKTNKMMRELAKHKNLKLSEYSLIDIDSKKEYIVNSEEDIFNLLEIIYINPLDR